VVRQEQGAIPRHDGPNPDAEVHVRNGAILAHAG
jgi:hypothetical protein